MKDSGRFTVRYCKGCSVGLCDECIDKEACRVYPRMIQIEARAAFFGLCKRWGSVDDMRRYAFPAV